jgi:hypothetical protein
MSRFTTDYRSRFASLVLARKPVGFALGSLGDTQNLSPQDVAN